MRILMLCHRLPYPPWTGDRVRAFHIARYLARNHELTLAFPLEGSADLDAVEQLRTDVPDLEYAYLRLMRRRVAVIIGLGGSRPLSVKYFASHALARRLKDRLERRRFDLIYVSSSAMAEYALGTSIPLVTDFVDVDSEKWRQYSEKFRPPMSWVYAMEARRLRSYEVRVASRSVLSIVTTAAEEALLRQFAPEAKTTSIPNGVDTDYFFPSESRDARYPTIIFTGALDYFPNIEGVCYFSREVFPLVRRRVPTVRFLIVGRRPSAAVQELANCPGIRVFGDVPDVRPYMREASVAVVPLLAARGIQNKVLEAMAMGLPVVATSSPAQGIGARIGVEWFVEDEPEALAARVISLVNDPSLREQVGHLARSYVVRSHSWSQILSRLDALLQSLASAGSSHDPARPSGTAEVGTSGFTGTAAASVSVRGLDFMERG